MSDNIQVAIRLRPLNERELKGDKLIAWKTPDQKSISQVDTRVPDQKYVFDRVYDCQETTLDIYEETVRDIVLAGIGGFNGTIFAYGQTSSGKTYTMSGTKLQMGIIPLAIESIFDTINMSPDREFLLRVSYMEIYNEKITDLLDSEEKTMKMLEDENRQIVVSGLSEEVTRSPDMLINLKKRGDARRRVGETARNEESSRSHAIFQIIIESQERQLNEDDLVDESVRLSSLYFVDLAGSEKASENSGERFREGCAINKSLMTLAQVIGKLSDGVSNQYINYRDSKLTRLLQNGLGGNSKTAIICTINPTAVDETNSTLRFASRAKNIKNKPTINELTDTSDKAILKRYQKEIADLHQQLEAFKKQTPRKTLNPHYNNNIHEHEKSELEKKYQNVLSKLKSMICVTSASPVKKKLVRRETWCPGVLKRKLEQAGHLPALAAIGTPSRTLGNILEETPSPIAIENIIPAKTSKLPVFYANSACQTENTGERDKFTMLKLETEMLRNQMTTMTAELNDLRSRPAKQRRVSFESHDETREFLELELELAQEGKIHAIEEEKKLEQDRRRFKEERINHDEAVRAFQAEKRQLMQRVEATEGENSCLLTNLESSKERVKKLEHELTLLQNMFATTTGGNNRRSMDRPLLNMSNITDRSKRPSRGDSESLKQEMLSLQSQVQMQETEIDKFTKDLTKCKEQLKNKCDEIRFLSMETNKQKEKLEVIEQENEKLTQTLGDKTPVSELPEVIELKTRLSEVSVEKDSLQQKLKSKSEELTYLSRQSAAYLEQIESKNICAPAENGKASEETLKTELAEEVEALKTALSTMEAEKSQVLRDLNINKMYCTNLKDQLKVKTDEYTLLQKNLESTHGEVVAMRNTLVEFKDQLLAKEELILELSQIRLADVSAQQSLLSSPDKETIDSLQDQLNTKSKAYENLTGRHKDLEGKNTSKSEDMINVGVGDQISTLNQDQETNDSLRDQLNTKSKECENLTGRLKDLEGKNTSKSEDMINVGVGDQISTLNQDQETNDSLRDQLNAKSKECENLIEQLQDLEVKNATKSQDEEVNIGAEDQSEKQDLLEQLSNAQQEKVALQEKYRQLMEQWDGMELLVAQQAGELSAAKQSVTEMEKCLDEVESEMKTQLNALRETCTVKEEECASLSEQLAQTRQEYDELASTANSHEEKQVALKAEAEAQSAELAKLKEQLSIAERDHDEKVKECLELNEQVSTLTEKLSQNSEKQHQLEKELEAQSEKCSELTESLRLAQESEQNKNVDGPTDGDSEDEIVFQTPASAEDIALLDSIREELDATREECQRLKGSTLTETNTQECEVLKQDLKTLKFENENLISACASMREQLTELKEDKKCKEELMDSLRKEFEDKSQDHKILTDQMKTLETQNENKMLACTSLSEKVSTLRQEKATSEEMLESLRAEFNAKEEELESLKKELEDFKGNSNSKCNECERLLEQLSSLKAQTAQEVSALENKMSLMQSEHESESLKQGPVTLADESKPIDTPAEMDTEMNDKDETHKSVDEKQALDLLKEELRAKSEECTNLSAQLQEMAERNMSQLSTAATQDNNEELSLCKHQLEDKIEECRQLEGELENIRDDYEILKMSLDELRECSQLADPTLQNQLSECQDKLESKTQECASLAEKLSEMERAICCKTEECSTLMQKMSTLEDAFSSKTVMEKTSTLKEALSSKTEECSTLTEKISSLEEVLSSKTEECSTLMEKTSTLEESLSSKTEECSTLMEKTSTLEEVLSSKTEECSTLMEKTSTLEEVLSSKTDECSTLTEKISSLEEVLSSLQNQLSECQATLESKTQECTSLEQTISEMEKAICSKSEECSALHEKISSLEEVLSSKTEECHSLTEKLEALNAAQTVKTEEASPSQQSVLDSKDDESTKVHQELEQLHEQYNLKTSECEDLSKQVSELKKNFEHIEGSLAEEMLKKISLVKELQTAKSDISMLREEIDQQSRSNQNFFLSPPAPTDDDKQALAAELETQTKKYSMLSDEMDNLKKNLEDLKSEKEDEAQTMRHSLAELQGKSLDYDVLVEEITRSDSLYENRDLSEEIAEKANELEEIREENARLANSVEQERQNLAVVRGELEESLSELESLRQECSALKEDLSEMNSKTNGLQESLRCAQEQEQVTAKKLSGKSLESEQLTNDLATVQKECESLKMSLLSLDEENNQLSSIQKDLHTTQSNLDAKINECSALSQHVETLGAEIESLKVSLLNLNDENQGLLASKEDMVFLKDELDTKSEDYGRLLKEVADLKEQKQSAQDLVALKETEISTIGNELESSLLELAKLKEQYEYLNKKFSEKEMENVSLRESMIKLDEQNDKLSTLNDCLVIKEKELVSKSEESAILSAELEAAKTSKSEALAEIESKLESKTQECLSLTKEMAALKERATSVEERFGQELESKCEEYALLSGELMSEKQNKMKMLEEMQLELSAKTEECVSLSKQVVDLQKAHGEAATSVEYQLAEKSEQCESLSAQLADLLQKHSELEELLNSEKSSGLKEQLKSLVEECSNLKEKLHAEEEKVNSLESELDAKNKSLEYKEGVCKFLYESNTSIKNEMDQMKDQINNSSLQKTDTTMTSMLATEELTQQLKKAQEERDSHKSVIKKLKREINELKDKMEEVQGKADLCETVLEENKAHLGEIETLSTENTTKTEMIAKLKMQDPNMTTNESNDQLQEKVQECRDLSEQLKKVQANLTEAKAQVKKLKIEKIKLEGNLEDFEGKAKLCEVYEKENKDKELKLKELEEEKLETTMRLTRLEQELERKPEISMMSMNQTEDLSELTQQLKKALEEKDSHKSVAKKLKIEKIKLADKMEDLESKADLCQTLLEENKAHLGQIENLSTENTKKNELIAKLKMQDPSLTSNESNESLAKLKNQLQEKAQECRDLSEQLKTVEAALMEAKAQAKKLKIDKIKLEGASEDLEGKANLCEDLQEEIKNYRNKIETLSAENSSKDEKINKLEIDVHEKQECIHMLETKTFSNLKGQELENLQRQLSKKSMHLVWAESDYIKGKAHYEKTVKSYEETVNILNEKIKYLKEELRLQQSEKVETTVKVPCVERKRTRSATQAEGGDAVQSQGFLDHMAFITLEAENSKLTRKVDTLKQKLSNAFKNYEEMKKEVQMFREKAEKENTPSKRKKVAEKSTNTEILKLSETNNTPTRTPTRTPRAKRADRQSPSRLRPQQREQASTEKDECRNQ